MDVAQIPVCLEIPARLAPRLRLARKTFPPVEALRTAIPSSRTSGEADGAVCQARLCGASEQLGSPAVGPVSRLDVTNSSDELPIHESQNRRTCASSQRATQCDRNSPFVWPSLERFLGVGPENAEDPESQCCAFPNLKVNTDPSWSGRVSLHKPVRRGAGDRHG